ncbi:uncharacterized protein I303_104194 [Kwoniella dejecticola CBS 10117]|uniref:Uncharacterized protein n=1 Tax=Kwoniella dejecticola CBS 10117 TaxID=1296121 RepID=A0A1A6A612_9TREE|nr:uncharacterized protein I303_04830 [Kwoniella dejecticola CBS 10117]OBR85494.1 hypothetical protein I303_04830 [Kwoniella dejecticola CBS 10117]
MQTAVDLQSGLRGRRGLTVPTHQPGVTWVESSRGEFDSWLPYVRGGDPQQAKELEDAYQEGLRRITWARTEFSYYALLKTVNDALTDSERMITIYDTLPANDPPSASEHTEEYVDADTLDAQLARFSEAEQNVWGNIGGLNEIRAYIGDVPHAIHAQYATWEQNRERASELAERYGLKIMA